MEKRTVNTRTGTICMWVSIFTAIWHCGPVNALETASGLERIRRHSVTWNSPSAETYDAMPLGNGSMGMLVSVAADGRLHLIVSRVDAWSEAHRLLKLGMVTVTFTPNPFGAAFQQRLHLDQGLITLQGAGGFPAEWRVDAHSPVFYRDAACDRAFTVERLDRRSTARSDKH